MQKLVLIFIMMLSAAISYAREFYYTYEGNTIAYTVVDEGARTCKVKSGNSASAGLLLPAHPMDGSTEYTLTAIGEASFIGCRGLTAVSIPNTVTEIGPGAFAGCSNLMLVRIPNSVIYIYSAAFNNCCNLTSLSIPNSVTFIDEIAFGGCSGLTSLIIPNSVTFIGDRAFMGCSGLTSVTIPNSVTSIGTEAFMGCSGLTSVTISESVTSIGEKVFKDCTALEKLFFNAENCTECGGPIYSVFGESLKTVIFGDKVKTIPDYAFHGCSGLTSANIPNSVSYIGKSAFYGCSSLTSVSIPQGVTSISDYAFFGCYGLRSVSIPNSVTSIGYMAFSGCTHLTSLSIPNSVTTIDASAFSSCTGLTSVAIPNSVTAIGKYAFSSCYGLRSVSIPNSVTSIGEGGFNRCSQLTAIDLGTGIKDIGFIAFYDISSDAVAEIHSPTLWSNITFGDTYSTPFYAGAGFTVNGVAPKHLVLDLGDKGVSDYAFAGAEQLESVKVKASKVGKGSFENCSEVKNLYLDVDAVGGGAFNNNDQIEAVYVNRNTPPVAEDNSFSKYDGVTLYVPRGAVEAYGNSATCWHRFANIRETDFGGLDNLFAADYDDPYADGAGIVDIVRDGSDAIDFNSPVEVYNLSGNYVGDSIDSLAPGIYIVRQGAKAVKCNVR